MKLLIGGIIVVAAVGGIVAYNMMNRKNEDMDETGEKSSDTFSSDTVNDAVEKNATVVNQTFENMNERNAMATEIITEIHDEMKTSQDNIDSKKAEIEKMMRELKK